MILVHDGWRFCKDCGICRRETYRYYYRLGYTAYGLIRWDNYCKPCRRRRSTTHKRIRRPVDNDPRVVACQNKRIDAGLRGEVIPLAPDATGAYQMASAVGERLDPGPFIDWLDQAFPGADLDQLHEALGIERKTLRFIAAGHQKTIGLTVVDRAFVRICHPELLATLYPL